MSIINKHQIISHLYRHNISHAMIEILEEQRINDEDLQMMDRDDIEHLFKNEYGFTFRDRKRVWTAIQKFQSKNTKNDNVYLEPGKESSDIYDIIENETPNYSLTEHYIPIPSSNSHTTTSVYDHTNMNIEGNLLVLTTTTDEEQDDDDDDDDDDNNNVQIATTSLPVLVQPTKRHRSKKSPAIVFQYPVELPTFSTQITRALETNAIENIWQTFITELARWVLSVKPTAILRREYRAIGQTLYKRYPIIGKDGFRPWSHLCKCLTQKIRTGKKKKVLLSK